MGKDAKRARKAAEQRRAQQRPELLEQLRDQLGFLAMSCRAYDSFVFAESKRLAVAARVLLHHTPSSHALLTQLDVQRHMLFEDSCGPLRPDLVMRMGALAMPSTNPRWGDWVAAYERRQPLPEGGVPQPRRFEAWWTEPLWRDDNQKTFNRKALVLSLANQDGGAHVDPALNEDYAALSRDNSLGIQRSKESMEGPWVDTSSPVPAAVRQIAHELVRSFQWWLPDALVKAGGTRDEANHVLQPIADYRSAWTPEPNNAHLIECPPGYK